MSADRNTPRAEEFVLEWVEAEKAKGLVDIKFFPFKSREVVQHDAMSELALIVDDIQSGRFTPMDCAHL